MRRQTWIDRSNWARSAAATAGSKVPWSISCSQLLDEGEHGPEGVVHVVRDAARQVGHRVLALGDQHSLFQRFGPPRVLEGHGRLGEELGNQLDFVLAERTGFNGRDLQDPQQAGAGDQGGAEDRPLARREPDTAACPSKSSSSASGVASVPVQSFQLRAVAIEAANQRAAKLVAKRGRQRQLAADVPALCLLPGDLLGDHLEPIDLVVVGQEGRGVVVGRQRADAVENLVKQVLGKALLEDLAIDAGADLANPFLIDLVDQLVGERPDRRKRLPLVPVVCRSADRTASAPHIRPWRLMRASMSSGGTRTLSSPRRNPASIERSHQPSAGTGKRILASSPPGRRVATQPS